MIRKNRHALYDLEFHLVVITKYRHPVIEGDLKKRLIELSHYILEEKWDCAISEINTDKDHIHILFDIKPQVQLSKLINNFKTVTSRRLRKEFEETLAPYYWKPYFWSDSYFIASVSERSHEQVRKYIKNQGIKPR